MRVRWGQCTRGSGCIKLDSHMVRWVRGCLFEVGSMHAGEVSAIAPVAHWHIGHAEHVQGETTQQGSLKARVEVGDDTSDLYEGTA